MTRQTRMPKLDGCRVRAGVVAVALAAGLAVGCSGGSGDSDDGDDPIADAGDVQTDGSLDAGTDDAGAPDAGEPDDAGMRDLGPPGSEVQFGGLQVYPPVPASCSEPGERHRVPFALRRNQNFTTPDGRLPPIREGDFVNGEKVEADGIVGAGSLTTRRTRVSEVSSTPCTSSADCPGELKCGASGVRGARRYCSRQTGVEFIPGTTRHDVEPNFRPHSKQIVALALDNTASYEGNLPNIVASKYDEQGESGIGTHEGLATDPDWMNREAVHRFSTFLASAANPENTQVSFWFFGGQNKTDAQPTVDPRSDNGHFSSDLETPSLQIDSHSAFSTSDGAEKRPVPKTANVYQAIHETIEHDLGLERFSDREKFLFVITDGPNEVYDPDATPEKLADKLDEHNIRLYILHLDAEIDPDLVRDLPTYWRGNSNCQEDDSCGAPTCSSDADCGNFETCRPATLYADSPPDEGGEVTETDAEYCLPDYSGGRTGPIDEYAEVTCQSGGNYFYLTGAQDLRDYADKLPLLVDGQWSIEAEFSALDERVGLADGFYRLTGTFLGLLAPQMATTMSAPTVEGARERHTNDTRGLLRLQTDDGE